MFLHGPFRSRTFSSVSQKNNNTGSLEKQTKLNKQLSKNFIFKAIPKKNPHPLTLIKILNFLIIIITQFCTFSNLHNNFGNEKTLELSSFHQDTKFEMN